MRIFFTLIILIFGILHSWSQLLPPNQPEQDACYALNLCGDVFYSPYSYQGMGRMLELSGTPCMTSAENNCMWLRVEVLSAGNIVFIITPVDSLDDYDFAVVNATGKSCRPIGEYQAMQLVSTDVIRCNYNNNLTTNIGYEGASIGLNNTSSLQFVRAGTTGSNFLQQITADSGDVYMILINNWGADGGPSAGFSIDFTGSTADFRRDPPPLYDSIQINCKTPDNIEVFLNAKVDCQSIAPDGSDFFIEPLGLSSIRSAEGIDCSGSDGYTERVLLKLNNPLPGGKYTIKPRIGSDGNSLLNACRIEQPLTDSFSFAFANPSINLGEDIISCISNPIQLNVEVEGTGGMYNIRWVPADFLNNTAIADPVCIPLQDITYKVTVWPQSQPECTVTDSVRIELLKGFELLNEDTGICLGDSFNLIVRGDSRYRYSWVPLGIMDSMNLNVHPESTTVYTVIASYPQCADSAQSVKVDVDRSILHSFLHVAIDKQNLCVGEQVLITPITDSASLYLSWSFAGIEYHSKPVVQQYAFDQPGIIPLSIKSHYEACPPVEYTDTLNVYPLPVVVLHNDTQLCLDGKPIVLSNLYQGQPDTLYQYEWNTGNTEKELKVKYPGVYTLTVTNEYGCTSTESVTIEKGCYWDIPNAFTPNGDGINDYFFLREKMKSHIASFRFSILNKWGEVVFVSDNRHGKGWDGRFDGVAQPVGVYVYIIDVVLESGQIIRLEGNVTLLR